MIEKNEFEIIEPTKRKFQQTSEKEGKRNKRIMNSILGHLERAKKVLKKDEITIKTQNNKLDEVYSRNVEENQKSRNDFLLKEREKYDKLRKERIDSLYDNDKAQTDLLCYKLTDNYSQYFFLYNISFNDYYITKSEPKIFYQPKKPIDNQKDNLKDTEKWIDNRKELIQKVRKEMIENIENIHVYF